MERNFVFFIDYLRSYMRRIHEFSTGSKTEGLLFESTARLQVNESIMLPEAASLESQGGARYVCHH